MANSNTGTVMLLWLLLFAMTSVVTSQGDDDTPCSMTFTVPASAIRSQCTGSQSNAAVQELREEFQAVIASNTALEAQVNALRTDYEDMIETVRRMEKETASWRTIVEWPQFDQSFTPDNMSLVMEMTQKYTDCSEAHSRGRSKQGIYTLEPPSAQHPFFAFCDEDGFTIIQRRFDGSVDFFRSWSDYAAGFGQLSGELWLGLENIHLLTKDKPQELRVEALGWNNKLYTEVYPHFWVGSEKEKYALHVGNMTEGDGHNVLAALDGQGFTTHDNDNDDWYSNNCAEYYHGAFWLPNCGFDPNRRWCKGRGCMNWGDNNIEKIVMKIRPSGSAPYRPPAQPTTTTTITTKKPKPKKKKPKRKKPKNLKPKKDKPKKP